MRNIEFRGQRVDNEEWMYGLPRYTEYTIDVKIGAIEDEHGNVYEDIKPETIGQFTELIDKNGNKIFEGDRVEYKGKFYEIRYFTDYGCYGMYDELKDKPLGRSGSSTKYEPYFLNKYHLNKIKVTGNIHEDGNK